MYKRFNQLLLAMAVFIIPLTCSSSEAKITQSADNIRLQQAGDLINSKQYKKGYVSFKGMANQGCPYSQCILGIMRQKGLGTRKSAIQAKYWFQKSARQGFADAENRLGQMYYHGDGIKKNLNLARQWLSKAAGHGVEEAKEALAQIPVQQIPGATNLSNKVAQAPQQVVGAATNIEKSWQGYAEVTKQLNQLSAATTVH